MTERIETTELAARLAERLLDPDRTRPIVGVTTPQWNAEPHVDLDDLAKALDDAAEIVVVATGDATWELSYRLPTSLDAYGGAVRVWLPGLDEGADRHTHPLIFVHDRADSPDVIARVVAAVSQHTPAERPVEGSEHAAVVTRVVPSGAELDLADGTLAFAHASHLSHYDLAPELVVRVGQAVRVRVGFQAAVRRRVPVSLLPFEPEPWDRVADYPVGTIVNGVVAKTRNFGAFVTVLPGFDGLVHKSQISHDWVSHPEDFLPIDDVVRVKIHRIDHEEQRLELSMRDVPRDAEATAMSIYPDGPAWLVPRSVPPVMPPPPGRIRPADEASAVGPDEPTSPAVPTDEPASNDDVASPPHADARPSVAPANVGHSRSHADATPTVARADIDRPSAPAAEVGELEQVIGNANSTRRELDEMVAQSERRLARLRSEAASVRRELENELAQVRRRILEVVESESSQLIGSTQDALDAARAEADDLREQLANAEDDRRQLMARLRSVSSRADRAEEGAQALRHDLTQERRTTDRLRDQVRRLGLDDAAELRDAIHTAWLAATTHDDRERYPWRDIVIGPDFVGSLRTVHGVTVERVIEVCAEVVCGRAAERVGFELHGLRSGDNGDAGQRTRAKDGAKAYRASLQVKTPSARRLHYWELPDDRIELAKIVYHDDFSIG